MVRNLSLLISCRIEIDRSSGLNDVPDSDSVLDVEGGLDRDCEWMNARLKMLTSHPVWLVLIGDPSDCLDLMAVKGHRVGYDLSRIVYERPGPVRDIVMRICCVGLNGMTADAGAKSVADEDIEDGGESLVKADFVVELFLSCEGEYEEPCYSGSVAGAGVRMGKGIRDRVILA